MRKNIALEYAHFKYIINAVLKPTRIKSALYALWYFLRGKRHAAKAAINQRADFYSDVKNIFYTTARIAQLTTLL